MKVNLAPEYCFHLSASLAKVALVLGFASPPEQPAATKADVASPPPRNPRRERLLREGG